jgi:hypothetical protein
LLEGFPSKVKTFLPGEGNGLYRRKNRDWKKLLLPSGDEKKGWILSKNLKRLIGWPQMEAPLYIKLTHFLSLSISSTLCMSIPPFLIDPRNILRIAGLKKWVRLSPFIYS